MTPDIIHALENLVENTAGHSLNNDAEIRVTLDEDPGGVAIAVEDNGPGIPPNELTLLERGQEDVLNYGSGIGLWIVTMVIDEIDGALRYDASDDGTRITLRIEG